MLQYIFQFQTRTFQGRKLVCCCRCAKADGRWKVLPYALVLHFSPAAPLWFSRFWQLSVFSYSTHFFLYISHSLLRCSSYSFFLRHPYFLFFFVSNSFCCILSLYAFLNNFWHILKLPYHYYVSSNGIFLLLAWFGNISSIISNQFNHILLMLLSRYHKNVSKSMWRELETGSLYAF